MSFASVPTAALEGVALATAIRVEARDASGSTATAPIVVTLEVRSPAGTVPISGTRTLTTRNGVASFTDIVIGTAGRSFTLVASAPGLASTTSPPFDTYLHFKQISSGATGACGLTYDNATWCWGGSSPSQPSAGDDQARYAPARVPIDLRFDTISVGGAQQCGRLPSNDVFCWAGQDTKPVAVAGRKFTWISSGQASCGIATGGALLCWNGPAGASVITPTLVDDGPFRVGATGYYTCAIDMNQRGFCQGGNAWGELGFAGPGATRFTQPVTGVRLTSIAPSNFHACGIDVDGIGWCWGINTFGQVGSAAVGDSTPLPVRVDGNHRFRSVTVGLDHSCGLATDGSAWCWGDGTHGQLGSGSTAPTKTPVRVVSPVPFVDLDAGMYFTCAIGTDGFAYCWGNNSNGELADGTMLRKSTPQRVVAPLP